MKKEYKEIKSNTVMFVREISVSYKALDTPKIRVNVPQLVAEFVRSRIGNESREHFSVLCINNKNMVVGYHTASIGTVTESIVHPREVYSVAILTGASGIIVCHNHPSGNVEPSRHDIETTRRLVEAGKIIGIPLVDHILVGFATDEFKSLKEMGYIP